MSAARAGAGATRASGDRDHRFALAVDLGTTGLKVGIVSLAGRIVWTESHRLHTRHGEGGAAHQDAGEWWELVTAAARRGLAAGAVDPRQVVAVGITGQWASTVPVDAAGEPVGHCVMWMDRQGRRHSRKVIGGPVAGLSPTAAIQWVRKTGGAPSPSGADPIGHMLHLQRDRPETAARARWFLEPVDYLAMRFTGVAAASHASMTAAWLTDNRDLSVLDYDSALVRRAGVDRSKLPPLRPTGSVVGEVRADLAADLGLTPGVLVVTGVPDVHSAALGCGAAADLEAHLPISTTSWISAPVPFKKTDILHSIASVPGLHPGGYVIVNNHETAGACLQWLRDEVLGAADGLPGSERAADVDFAALTELAAGSEPGAGGVIFTPWLAGERSPVDDPLARGGWHNLSLATTRADLVRAVMEGVAHNARWLLEEVESFAKSRLDPIRIFGGGAQSDLWCQIHADVLDRTVDRVTEPLHANVRGAALLAGMALGDVRLEECRSLVPVEATFRPDAAHRVTYERLSAELPRLYKAQKSMFRRLNRSR